MDWSNIWQVISAILFSANLVLAVMASIFLISKKEDPVKTLSWVMVMILLPYIGLILYLLFGRNFRKEKMFNRKGAGDLKIKENLSREMLEKFKNPENIPSELTPFRKLIIQNLKTSQSLLTTCNSTQIFFSGGESLTAMLEAIASAKKHIHLQSFILEDDKVGNRFKDLLMEKSREGIEVRLMYDGFGSRALSKEFVAELKSAGVEILVFSPFRWFFPPPIVNYRNHRKILVIDGIIGFLGGVNIADRYFDGGVFQEWRDTHIKIEGSAVLSLQASFLLDRFFILNKNLRKRDQYYPNLNLITPDEDDEKHVFSQIISSGPDSDWSGIMQCFFTAITQAKNHIYIITPYFTPCESILNAIKITALSGVEVCIMIPERSDTWITHWGTMSYLTELLRAGVKIYLFRKGFNHSKVLSIDGEYCIIGSANMDNRSLEHNFEVTSILYDQECTRIVEEQFRKDLTRCTLIHQSKWKKRNIKSRIFESVARLVSPLL